MHNDYTEQYSRERVRDLLPDEADELLRHRFTNRQGDVFSFFFFFWLDFWYSYSFRKSRFYFKSLKNVGGSTTKS